MSRKVMVEMKSYEIPLFLFVQGITGQYRVQCGCGYKKFILDNDQKTARCGQCKVVLAVRVTNENVPKSKGQPIFMDVPDIGVFRMQCFCGFDEFAFTIDKSCFCCADCLGVIARRELGGAEADMSQATWKI